MQKHRTWCRCKNGKKDGSLLVWASWCCYDCCVDITQNYVYNLYKPVDNSLSHQSVSGNLKAAERKLSWILGSLRITKENTWRREEWVRVASLYMLDTEQERGRDSFLWWTNQGRAETEVPLLVQGLQGTGFGITSVWLFLQC